MVIFTWGIFRKNVGKTLHIGIIITILVVTNCYVCNFAHVGCFEDLHCFSNLSAILATWKQEINNVWNHSSETANWSRTSCSLSQELNHYTTYAPYFMHVNLSKRQLIFTRGKFHKNVGKTLHVGLIFMILVLFFLIKPYGFYFCKGGGGFSRKKAI